MYDAFNKDGGKESHWSLAMRTYFSINSKRNRTSSSLLAVFKKLAPNKVRPSIYVYDEDASPPARVWQTGGGVLGRLVDSLRAARVEEDTH